jgi:hypothetical protein
MDQNFNRQPLAPRTEQSTNSTPQQYQPPSVLPPASPAQSQVSGPHISANRKVFATIISVLVFLALVLALVSLLMVDKKVDKTEQANIEKRLSAIEEEDKYTEQQVDSDRFQAVFLSSGQTYFGKITEVTKDTIKLEDIYYLKSGTVDKAGNPTVGTDMSLVKLGSELHAPDDVMFIERKNISFWENLKNDGQVTKAINDYKKT